MRFRCCASRFTDRGSFADCHSSARRPSAVSTAYSEGRFIVTREFASSEPLTPYGLAPANSNGGL